MDTSNQVIPASGDRSNMFLPLPTELIQYIAYLLPTDADRINLALCSSDLAAQILPAESHIWRRLFQDTYDDNLKRTIFDYKIEYHIRAIVLSRSIGFGYGQQEKQTYWLELLRDMIQETSTESGSMDRKNVNCIRRVLFNSEFLNRPVSGHMMRNPDLPSVLFCAVQLAVTYLAFDPSMFVRCLRTDYDIGAVYAFPGTEKELFDDHFTMSIETALDIRNFWLRHLLNPDEGTFYTSYMNLPEYHRPAPPAPMSLIDEKKPKLPLSWLGYESCICPLPATLSDLEIQQTCADLNGHIVEVEHITLQLEEHPDPENWPGLFEEYVTEFRDRHNDERTFFRGIQTYHGSGGDRSAPVRGFIEGVSGYGIRGCWLRISFVAYESSNGQQGQGGSGSFFNEPWPPTDMFDDFTSIYGYSGVVDPEGSLMVGHWWDPRADEDRGDRGPFIFWCIC